MLICLEKGCTCFHHRLLDCMDRGLNVEAQELLQKIENLRDAADASGKTLLHYAVECGNTPMVEHLIEKGCKVTAQDAFGVTPLMSVVPTANERAFEVLLKNNADIYVADSDGVSTLERSFYVNVDMLTADYEVQLFHTLYEVKGNHRRIFKKIIEKVNKDFLSDKQATTKLLLNASCQAKLAVVTFCNIELASIILQNHFAIEFRESKLGLTALHCTGIFEKSENAELLIERGANVEAVDKTGVTPLMLAVKTGNLTITELLLKNNADMYVTDSNGVNALQHSFYVNVHLVKSPLHQFLNSSVKKREDHRLILNTLIEKVNEDFVTDRQTTAKLLLNANRIVKLAVVAFCNVELATLILQNDYPIEYREPKLGLTALHCASILGKLDNVKLLIERRAKIDATDDAGVTPLMLAVKIGLVAVIETLVNNNADVLVADSDDVNALQCSLYVNVNLHEMISFLHPTIRNKQRPALAMIAEKVNQNFLAMQSLSTVNHVVRLAVVACCNVELASLILQNDLYSIDFREPKLGYTALHCAVILGNLKNTKFLIKRGANIDALDEAGCTPLHYYTRNLQFVDGNSDVLKRFLKRTTNFYVRNYSGYTVVNVLLGGGTKATVRTVLQSGIDIAHGLNPQPLQYVLMSNKNLEIADIIELGIAIDANLFMREVDSSILISQAVSGHVDRVEYLLEHGADVNFVTPKYKSTAIWETAVWAFSRNVHETIELLLQFGAATAETTCSLINYQLGCGQQSDRPIKLLVAHLAMLAAIDRSAVTEDTRSKIDADSSLKSHFDICSQQLVELKNTVVFGKLTLFELLFAGGETLVKAYVRNQEFITAFKTAMGSMTLLDSYYVNTLQRRVKRAVRKAKAEDNVAKIIEFVKELNDDIEDFRMTVNIQGL